MKLVIHAHQVEAPRDTRSFVHKHVVQPLMRLSDSPAHELTVQLDDLRPSKGGVDQRCRLTLRIPNTRQLTVESVAEDMHASMLDAGRRLKRLVEREVGKQRSTSRSPMSKPLGRTFRERATRREMAPDGFPSTL